MKYVIFAMALVLASGSVQAAASAAEKRKFVRGEFSENIVESVKNCTPAELARANAEVFELEEQLLSVRSRLQQMEEYEASGKYKSDLRKERTLTLSSMGLVLVGGVTSMYANSGALRTAGFITWAMGFIGTYGRMKMEISYVEYQVRDIPKLKKDVERLLEQIRIRKALLETASQIKAEQAG